MTVSEQRQALLNILNRGAISSLFQPIVSSLEQRVIGYEALSRGPSNSPLHSPLTLFAAARYHGMLTELEMLCRSHAIDRFCALRLPGKLFLNVSPESLLEQQHYSGGTLAMLEAKGLTPDRVVIELTEQAPIEDLNLLQTALHHYRDMGFSIALDDLGAGYSSLRLWTLSSASSSYPFCKWPTPQELKSSPKALNNPKNLPFWKKSVSTGFKGIGWVVLRVCQR